MHKISTKEILKHIPSGIVRFEFLISPLFVKGPSIPINANLNNKDAAPMLPTIGEEVHCKFSEEINPVPIIINNTSGIVTPPMFVMLNRVKHLLHCAWSFFALLRRTKRKER